jgi:polysaccharide chain length determinant protein (PEP-CTERM system associated)
MNLDQGIQVIDLFGLARRRGKLMAIASGAVILVTFWISMALPNLYVSSAMILVEPQSVDESLVDSGVLKSNLSDRLGLMTAEILSRSRLSKIITEMDLYQDEHDDMQRFEVVDLMRSFVIVEPVLNELEVQRRNQDVNFNTFRIVFKHEKPRIAKEVAQRIANDFINANITSRTEITAKSLEFMGDEIESLTGQLAVVERQIAEVKAANVGSLPEEMGSNQRMLQLAMGDLRGAQRNFDAAMSDTAFWKNQALTALSMSSPNDPTSPTNRLRFLEIERGSLLARGFTEKHPDIVRVESEIVILNDQIAGADANEDAPRSFGEQNARAEQGRAELRAGAANEDIERLREAISVLETRLAAMPGVAEQLDALDRQYDHLYTSYQDFSARLQQAGVQADLERRQLGEKFRILESAEIAPEPSSPNRLLLLSLGAILGLALGAGIGLLAEMTDSSLHTTNELQSALGIPVLASVPRIMLESDRVVRSQRILRETLAAVGVVVFVLAGGIATYYFVNGNFSEGSDDEEIEQGLDPAIEARLDFETRRG